MSNTARKKIVTDAIPSHDLTSHIVSALLKNALPANIMVLIGAVFLSVVISLYSNINVIYWFIIVLALTALRLGVYYLYMHHPHSYSDEQLLNAYTYLTLLLGICLAAVVALIPDGNAANIVTPLVFQTLSIIYIAAISILSIHLRAFFYYIIPVTIGAAWYVSLYPSMINTFLLLLMFSIGLFSTIAAIKMNRATLMQLSLQEKNKGLISNLKSEVNQREKAQIELVENRRLLEDRVKTRTEQLLNTNNRLDMEISKRKDIEQSLHHITYTDPLTNLPNHLTFTARLNQIQESTKKEGVDYAVLIVDIKGFTDINKNYGFEMGNQILKTVSKVLSTILTSASISRYSGDRFIVLLENINSENNVTEYCKKIISKLKDIQVAHHTLSLSARIGVSICCIYKNDNHDLIAQAEHALTEAKTRNINFCLYSHEDINMSSSMMNYIDELNAAIDTNQLFFCYQPIISLKSNQVTSLEALLRWQHDIFGVIGPEKILSIAKDADILYKIDEYALKSACQQIAIWRAHNLDLKKITVNFSGSSKSLANIVKNISRILLDTNSNGKWIEIEISEDFIVQASDESIKQIHFLKQMGFSFTVDNFGSGYTSFFKFQQLPINAIKINQILLGQLLQTSEKGLDRMLNSIKSISHGFGLLLIIKGIETKEDEAAFNRYGYDLAQGNFYSKPLSVDEVPDFVKQYPADSQKRPDENTDNEKIVYYITDKKQHSKD